MRQLATAVVGCGLIGRRRAEQVGGHPNTELVAVVDTNAAAALALATERSCDWSTDWRPVVDNPAIDLVIAATPNAFLRDIAIAALGAGKHVLIEKPMGRNATEALQIAEAANAAKRILKVGFNHRYHPALAAAHGLSAAGAIGSLISIRARYGHGGRPGYEHEWRGNAELAGGGELTDQGVHIADLIQWFAGVPASAFALLQSAVWPIAPLEDNAFGLFRFHGGPVASIHTSWTQWKNLFSFEIFGTLGSLTIEGLGGSYGIERMTVALRNPEGGVPYLREKSFEGPDTSWRLEWDDFVAAVTEGATYWGTPADGLAAMRMIDALYASARTGVPAEIL